MKITIHNKYKLTDLQEKFTQAFPYLKLEFVKSPLRTTSPHIKHALVISGKTFGDYKLAASTKNLSITGTMNVKELEQKFFEIYGLGVNVLRKSGNVWLETTVTESWTLNQQNEEGISLNAYLNTNGRLK